MGALAAAERSRTTIVDVSRQPPTRQAGGGGTADHIIYGVEHDGRVHAIGSELFWLDRSTETQLREWFMANRHRAPGAFQKLIAIRATAVAAL